MTRWKIGNTDLDLSRPIGVGIVNVTTDSMFEGARSETPEQAIDDGIRLLSAGFDIVDVGAVAARAGLPVGPEEEAAALVPVIEGLALSRNFRSAPVPSDVPLTELTPDFPLCRAPPQVKAPVSKTGDSRFESWLPRSDSLA